MKNLDKSIPEEKTEDKEMKNLIDKVTVTLVYKDGSVDGFSREVSTGEGRLTLDALGMWVKSYR